MDLLEAAPAFVCCSELGGSTFRGTDLLALVGNQPVFYCPSIVERLSLFQRVHVGRLHCIPYIYIHCSSICLFV